MYERHRVLHRGVSYGNILLLLAPAYVALIDFDLAISADPSDHGAGNRTGTFDFLAVGNLLERVPHIPRRDLGGVRVLLWLCTEWVRDEATGEIERRDLGGTNPYTFPRCDAGNPDLQSVGRIKLASWYARATSGSAQRRSAVIADLHDFEGPPVPTQPVTPATPRWRRPDRRRQHSEEQYTRGSHPPLRKCPHRPGASHDRARREIVLGVGDLAAAGSHFFFVTSLPILAPTVFVVFVLSPYPFRGWCGAGRAFLLGV